MVMMVGKQGEKRGEIYGNRQKKREKVGERERGKKERDSWGKVETVFVLSGRTMSYV